MTLNHKIFLGGMFLIGLLVGSCAQAADGKVWDCDTLTIQRHADNSLTVCNKSDVCLTYDEPSWEAATKCNSTIEVDGDGIDRDVRRCVTVTPEGVFKGVLTVDTIVLGTVKHQCH